MTRFILILLLLLSFPAQAAIQPSEKMADPLLETRALALYRQVRCVVCESQSVAGSDSEMAAALRALIREKLMSGASNAEILAYLQSRYGDAILMKPPLKPATLLLWFMPVFILLGGLFLVLRLFDKRPSS